MSDDIPQAFTPKIDGLYGYRQFPDAFLEDCTEPLHEGIPDLRGIYDSTSSGYFARIEQCGDRLTITANGVVHDFLHADGTAESGVDDVVGTCVCNPNATEVFYYFCFQIH